jgi:hypothetical protein
MANRLACRSNDEWLELLENPEKFRKRFRSKRKSKSQKMEIELQKEKLKLIKKNAETEEKSLKLA